MLRCFNDETVHAVWGQIRLLPLLLLRWQHYLDSPRAWLALGVSFVHQWRGGAGVGSYKHNILLTSCSRSRQGVYQHDCLFSLFWSHHQPHWAIRADEALLFILVLIGPATECMQLKDADTKALSAPNGQWGWHTTEELREEAVVLINSMVVIPWALGHNQSCNRFD